MGTAIATSKSIQSEEIFQLQQELIEKDKLLAQKDEELQSYLHMLSHELKTPIVTMQGYTSLLEDMFGDLLPEDGKKFLKGISNNVERLETLVKDLLTLSGIAIQHSEFTVVDINDLVDDIIIDLYGAYQFKKQPFTVQENMPKVFGHRDFLRHVYTNLLVNSIKYSNENVPLKIEIGCSFDEIFPKFFVKDNGVGIPSSARKRIFNMFARAGNKKNVSGTGIGLVIVQKIIEAHDGEIWFDSKKGEGTVFNFTLPVQKEQTSSF
ncbi:MAG: sensor histidine kinase [Calditrichaeota bacterium]|nr:MAG: sensor histidine kinase [Calditrichota bacterium]